MGYTAGSFSAGEQPTTSKWNTLWNNDASFNDGTGIGNAVITADKMALGGSTAAVATSQTTASTSFTDLATSGPAVTVTIGANGLALVIVQCQLKNSGVAFSHMTFAVSGATTIAAGTYQPLGVVNTNEIEASVATYVSSLTPGSNTFTAKYKVTGGTGTFSSRTIIVIPL